MLFEEQIVAPAEEVVAKPKKRRKYTPQLAEAKGYDKAQLEFRKAAAKLKAFDRQRDQLVKAVEVKKRKLVREANKLLKG